MPEVTEPNASASPVPVDTTSATVTGGLQPPAPAPAPGPAEPQPLTGPPIQHQSWFTTMAHSAAGAILGTIAAREKETEPARVDENGIMQPAKMEKANTHDQLRQIARSALLGLAAGSRIGPQKSSMAAAAAGLGAGAEDAINRQKDQGTLERKQASEDFERAEQVKLRQATNAHTIIETAKAVQELRNSTYESQSKFASLGQDELASVVEGGNKVVAQDMHMSDIMKYKQSNPEYMNLTPFLTKVLPQEGGQIDPKTGEAPTDRYYSLAELDKPVKMTQSMINHLKTVAFPGADSLEAGQSVPGDQYRSLWHNGLVMYNNALRDPKNKDVIDVTGADGTPMKAVYNKTTNTTEILRDENGEPLGGKVETEHTRLKAANGKVYDVLFNSKNGKTIKNMGEAGSASDNSMLQTYGDMSLYGKDYLDTVEEPMKTDMIMIGGYTLPPEAFGRSAAGRMGMLAGVGHGFPNFDEKLYKLRFDYLKQYQSSSSADGASRTRLNTAVGHLNMLSQAAEALAKNDVLWFNKVANEFGYQIGTSPVVAYKVIGEKAAGEAAGAVKGGQGGATEGEIAKQEEFLTNPNLSKAGHQSAVRETLRLLNTQQETLEGNFKQAMGQSSKEFGRPVLLEKNQAIMDQWLKSPGSQSGQGIPGLPPNAFAARDKDKNIVGYTLNGNYTALPKPIPAQGVK